MLFERQIFHRLSDGRFDAEGPDVSQPTIGGYGPGGAHHSIGQPSTGTIDDVLISQLLNPVRRRQAPHRLSRGVVHRAGEADAQSIASKPSDNFTLPYEERTSRKVGLYEMCCFYDDDCADAKKQLGPAVSYICGDSADGDRGPRMMTCTHGRLRRSQAGNC